METSKDNFFEFLKLETAEGRSRTQGERREKLEDGWVVDANCMGKRCKTCFKYAGNMFEFGIPQDGRVEPLISWLCCALNSRWNDIYHAIQDGIKILVLQET